jgi:carbon-monoxide dehydrogenase iron sulfur subunit
MKKVYVEENWCLGCHLCEYYCAYANSGKSDMAKALRGAKIRPNIRIEEGNAVNFAVSCRHCNAPHCVGSCISGALSIEDGVIKIDKEKCVGCYTCILNCPYGAIRPSEGKAVQKCELCLDNSFGEPACVQGCINRAIVYEEREEA